MRGPVAGDNGARSSEPENSHTDSGRNTDSRRGQDRLSARSICVPTRICVESLTDSVHGTGRPGQRVPTPIQGGTQIPEGDKIGSPLLQSVFRPESAWSPPPIRCTTQVERARESPHRFRAEHGFPKGTRPALRSFNLCSDPNLCGVPHRFGARHVSSEPENPHTDSGRNTDSRRGQDRLSARSICVPTRICVESLTDSVHGTCRASQRIPTPIQGGTQIPEEDKTGSPLVQSVFRPESVWSPSPIQCTARVERARESPHRFRAEHRFPKRTRPALRSFNLCSDPNLCGVPHRFGARHVSSEPENPHTDSGRNTDSRRGQDRLSAPPICVPTRICVESLTDSVHGTCRASQRIPTPIQGGTQIPEGDKTGSPLLQSVFRSESVWSTARGRAPHRSVRSEQRAPCGNSGVDDCMA